VLETGGERFLLLHRLADRRFREGAFPDRTGNSDADLEVA